jgi:NAD(P)-dependent dehydrogenase (short-subunit alcohol dehydrogenase family)
MTTAQDLAGKVVVVTGAGRGIGRQIAIGAGQRGAKVALVEVIAENLDSTVNELLGMGINAKGYQTDISSETQIIWTD